MDTYTSRYGVINDYTALGKSRKSHIEKSINNSNVWIIYTYSFSVKTRVSEYHSQLTIYNHYIDNYLGVWSQSSVVDQRGSPYGGLGTQDVWEHNYTFIQLKERLKYPLSDDIIDKIKKEWYFQKDCDSLIDVLQTYVNLYMETKTLKEELRLARLPPSKKPIDEEIAELQTRIMELYAEKGKN
jgi:hypothetical protein